MKLLVISILLLYHVSYLISCQKDVIILENGVSSPKMDTSINECSQFSIRIPYHQLGHTEISALNSVPIHAIFLRKNIYATPEEHDYKISSTSSFNFPLAENTSFINWFFCIQGNTIEGQNAQYIVTVSLTDRGWRTVLIILGSLGFVFMILCCCLVTLGTLVFVLLNYFKIINSSSSLMSEEEKSTLLIGKGKGKYRVPHPQTYYESDSFRV